MHTRFFWGELGTAALRKGRCRITSRYRRRAQGFLVIPMRPSPLLILAFQACVDLHGSWITRPMLAFPSAAGSR